MEIPERWDARFSLQLAPRVEVPPPSAAPPPPDKRRSISMILLGVVVVVAVTAAAGWFAWWLTEPSPPPEETLADSSNATATVSSPVPASASAAEVASAAALPSPSSAASVTATARAQVAPGDVTGCFESLLPENAFGESKVDLAPLCKESHGYRSMLRLKSELVRAGGRVVTPAMLEWSKLGWYETAAYAVMRAHCCPADAPALTAPEVIRACEMEEALAHLANAIDDAPKMKAALDDYAAAAQCIADKNYPDLYGRMGPPYGIERPVAQGIIDRVFRARGH